MGQIHVNNQMPHTSTSIHWHGIDQKNSTMMDGVTGVTQCAIPPGGSFTYEFKVIDQRGTFWYHSHTSVQYTDGLFGPIVRMSLGRITEQCGNEYRSSMIPTRGFPRSTPIRLSF